MCRAGLIPTNSEGRRLILQGGVFINDIAVSDPARRFTKADLIDGEAILRKGKKVYHRVK
jgi:tyrosyl-tRNA synthetase